jgi:hypothetical protein
MRPPPVVGCCSTLVTYGHEGIADAPSLGER